MAKLVSEQRPNDGGYHTKRLVNEANDRLGQIGKHGKRAKIVAKGGSLSLQFSFKDGNGKSQKNVGLGGIPSSVEGIKEAEKIAQLVTGRNRSFPPVKNEPTAPLWCMLRIWLS
ncbi:MAG: hypothetical protein QNJ53_15765 [Pleurocapsa sp. MO_192.B19]|nr:hypothetical protein [Pleurocapsa sp. MO_192.B19]